VRYERTPAFDADWAPLTSDERAMFKAAGREFAAACDRRRAQPGGAWPAKRRVKSVTNADGVFEMTWSFAGPDGRATWEWSTVEVDVGQGRTQPEPAVRWRRIGSHRIFRDP
jgi:hypothetical protein